MGNGVNQPASLGNKGGLGALGIASLATGGISGLASLFGGDDTPRQRTASETSFYPQFVSSANTAVGRLNDLYGQLGRIGTQLPSVPSAPTLSLQPYTQAFNAQERALRADLDRLGSARQAGRGFGTGEFTTAAGLGNFGLNRAMQLGQLQYQMPIQQFNLQNQAFQNQLGLGQQQASLIGQQANLAQAPTNIYGQMVSSELGTPYTPNLTPFERAMNIFGGLSSGASQAIGGYERGRRIDDFIANMSPYMFNVQGR